MREGELAALTWNDVDPENNIIDIDKALQHLKGKGIFVKSTKTEDTRKISVPKSVITLLKEYKVWQNGEKAKLGDLWQKQDMDFIFTARDGKPMFPSTISKWFLKFIRKHNDKVMNDDSIKKEDKKLYLLDEVNFHGLRHTSATILISLGVVIPTVSERLGHKRVSTTIDIYSHSLKRADKSAADKLDNLFNKNVNNKNQG